MSKFNKCIGKLFGKIQLDIFVSYVLCITYTKEKAYVGLSKKKSLLKGTHQFYSHILAKRKRKKEKTEGKKGKKERKTKKETAQNRFY